MTKTVYSEIRKDLPYLEEAYELMLNINSINRTRERQIVEGNKGSIKKIHDIMLDDIFTCPYIQAKIECRSGSAYIGAAWKLMESTTINNTEDSAQLSDYVKKGLANFINYMRAYYTAIQQSPKFDYKRDGKDFANYMQIVDEYENDAVMKRHLMEYGRKYYSKEVLGMDPYDSVGLVDDFLEDAKDYVKSPVGDGSLDALRSWILKFVRMNKVTPKDFDVESEMTFERFIVDVVGYQESTAKEIMKSIFPEYKVDTDSRVLTVDIDDIDIDWEDGEDDE